MIAVADRQECKPQLAHTSQAVSGVVKEGSKGYKNWGATIMQEEITNTNIQALGGTIMHMTTMCILYFGLSCETRVNNAWPMQDL